MDHFDIEVTARCNLDCRHCDINLPEGAKASKKRELSADEIGRLAGEAAALGAAGCLITGGEPLLRKDFRDIFQAVLSKGLRLSVSTNATLVTDEIIHFLKKFPPRDVEVSVFGVTRETYERVTRTPGSFEAFKRGLDRLLGSGITIRLKAMALRSNKHEIPAIGDFCRAQARSAFCFEPHLHLRFDRDEARNIYIRAERLSPREIVRLERSASEHIAAAADVCAAPLQDGPRSGHPVRQDRRLFRCGAGQRSFEIGPEGILRPCRALQHPDFLYDLTKGSLADALDRFMPEAFACTAERLELPVKCRLCPVAGLCLSCPAYAYLETGKLDVPVEDYCLVAAARAEGL